MCRVEEVAQIVIIPGSEKLFRPLHDVVGSPLSTYVRWRPLFDACGSFRTQSTLMSWVTCARAHRVLSMAIAEPLQAAEPLHTAEPLQTAEFSPVLAQEKMAALDGI